MISGVGEIASVRLFVLRRNVICTLATRDTASLCQRRMDLNRGETNRESGER